MTTKLVGGGGPVPLIDVFDGRSQLIAYFQMWHTARPAAEQCVGWTVPWFSVPPDSVDPVVAGRHFGILVSYLRNTDKLYETYWTAGRGNEVMAPSYGLLHLTVYGRQELWEDSPAGWPQRWDSRAGQFRLDGRPIAPWSRIKAGRNDDLGTAPGDHSKQRSQ